MPSERIQRHIERLLDEADAAVAQRDWAAVRDRAREALALDPENADAAELAAAAGRMLAASEAPRDLSAEEAASMAAAMEWALTGDDPSDQADALVDAQHAAQLPDVSPAPNSFANGRYEVRRFLGEGGKKKVYLAHDTLLDRDVAFALIKTEGLDAAARTRITREAQAMGRLGDHPNIVTVFDIGEESSLSLRERVGVRGTSDLSPPSDTQPYMVLPLLPGGDVEGLIEKAPDQKLSIDQALKIAGEVCRGLEFAHGKGIVHRDLKPGNVWLSEDGTAKIGDFGLAVAVDRSRLTQAGMMVGTVSYMPPEQAMGGEVTPRSDLYSLGAMLYEMVCGRPPFVGDESVAIIGQHLNTPPVAPTWHRPDCPAGLEALILRLLEKDPGRRPESAREVIAALESVRPEALEGQALSSLAQGAASNVGPGAWPAGGVPAINQATDATVHPSRASGRTDQGAPSQLTNPLYRSTFVGREQELKQLQAAFDAALSGNGGLVMVVGEPGIGKTALCEQLATYAALRGGRALVGHSYEEGSLSLPYLAFVEAMRSYVLAREPDGLKSDLGSGAADVARIVSEVRDRVQGVELRPAGDPEDDRWRLLQAVTGFLRNASTVQPLLIVLEDLHWADRGTLDLLQHVARNLQGARLLIVGTYRDVEVDRTHPLSATLAELRRSSNLPRVLLRGLTVDEVHRMYEAIRGQSVTWAQAELVHRQTEGHPLFVQEVLRYLVEEGLVVREGGRYQVRPEAAQNEAVLPDGLRDVVGRRLSRLSDKTNQVLSVAAVMGREFRLDVLQKLLGTSNAGPDGLPLPGERVGVRGEAASPTGVSTDEESLFAALEEAQGRAIIEQRQLAGALGFRFTHAFFRTTLYEEIFAPRRIRLHQQVGRALEDVYARRLDEHAAELAEHFSQSTETADLEKAVRYGELAAERALAVYAYSEAVRHLEEALRAQEVLDSENMAKLCDLLLLLAEALGPAGEPEKSRETAEKAFEVAEALSDRARCSRACQAGLYGLFRQGGQLAGTTAWQLWAERADKYAEPLSVSRAQADIALGQMYGGWGDFEQSGAHYSRAHDAARRLGDAQSFFRSAIFLMFTLGEEERLSLAEELCNAGRQGVSAMTQSGALAVSANVFLDHGLRDRAESNITQIRELQERTHEPITYLQSQLVERRLLFFDGRLDAVLDNYHLMQATAREVGYGLTGPFELDVGRAFLYQGEEGERAPRPASNDLLAHFPSDANQSPLFVQQYLLSGPQGLTAEKLLEAREREEETSHVPAYLVFRLLEAASLTNAMNLLPWLLDMGKPFERLTMAGNFACPARLLGDACVLLNRPAEARDYYNQALEVCEQVRFRPEIALTRLGLAELLLEHYPDERPTAIEHLDFAIREFREMKMQPSLERALRHRELLKA